MVVPVWFDRWDVHELEHTVEPADEEASAATGGEPAPLEEQLAEFHLGVSRELTTPDSSALPALGIRVSPEGGDDDYLHVDAVSPTGLISQAHRGAALYMQKGDRIVAVNGAQGPARDMMKELLTAHVLVIVVQKGTGDEYEARRTARRDGRARTEKRAAPYQRWRSVKC